MTTPSNDWKEVRSVHLLGGCRAINKLDQNVQFEPDALNGKKAAFAIKADGATFSGLETLNLEVIGTDFYSHSLELKGITPRIGAPTIVSLALPGHQRMKHNVGLKLVMQNK